MTTTATGCTYPLSPNGEDRRFTYGLVYDVARLLESHGYPRVEYGGDVLDLQQALFRFLYGRDRLSIAFEWTQPLYTNCNNCGTADHRGYACPCECHANKGVRHG